MVLDPKRFEMWKQAHQFNKLYYVYIIYIMSILCIEMVMLHAGLIRKINDSD